MLFFFPQNNLINSLIMLKYSLFYYWHLLSEELIERNRGVYVDDEKKTPEEIKGKSTKETASTAQKTSDVTKPEHKKDDQKGGEHPKKDGKPGKDKQPKKETKETMKKTEDFGPDFQYIVRIANTDLDGKRKTIHALTQIKGIGWHLAYQIAETSGVNKDEKVGNLKEPDILKLKETLEKLDTIVPPWMLNHRLDYDTGINMHLISTEVNIKLRDDINLMKMIRCYRGVRHEFGLPVRGQRTKANGRVGLAMGVQKRTVAQQAASSQASKSKE